jgi:YidC/Oxa1 family membrane protein insertase
MSNDKRIVLFIIVMVAWMIASPYLMRLLGIDPGPRKPPTRPPNAAAGKVLDEKGDRKTAAAADLGKGKAQSAGGKAQVKAANEPAPKDLEPKKPDVEVVNETDLVLGSVADKSPEGYRLEVQLQQNGGGVDSVASSRYDAEFEDGRVRKRPLQLMRRDPVLPPSLAVTLSRGDGGEDTAAAAVPEPENPDERALARAKTAEAEDLSDSILWEVVRDDKGRIVRPIARDGRPADLAAADGQAVVFRHKSQLGVVVTKTFRLCKNSDRFEVDLKFESPDKERSLVYNLLGPHGIRIEGEWYTGTFRDVIFGQVGRSDPVTYSAYDVANAKDKPVESTGVPLRYAGVENQYFATLVGPYPLPKNPTDRWDAKTTAIVLHKVTDSLQKSDVGVKITSRPVTVRPDQPVSHTYRVFAGPKVADSLKDFGPEYEAERLASYHKSQWGIPFASDLARHVITPTLAFTYYLTERVARLFGGTRGNYGIAIFLLTVIVRGLMFPLGRKQARVAQKMQELQPELKAIQEKYKDDKEKQTKETLALYRRHGNPQYSGCLPALIQLPIFVGLWQALNNSVPLRHASFLWIRDLAAPDMLFRFPFELPLVGYYLGHWFNVLPFAVVGLMLVQTKLFSPPPTSPEAEMQQKMMKWMMVLMGFMFYKVPSGLGIYLITSSAWAICERLLLPKVTHAQPQPQPAVETAATGKTAVSRAVTAASGAAKAAPGATAANGAPEKPPGKIAQFLERLLEEAQKDATYRKMVEERESRDRDRDGKSPRDRDKGKPRSRPGRR